PRGVGRQPGKAARVYVSGGGGSSLSRPQSSPFVFTCSVVKQRSVAPMERSDIRDRWCGVRGRSRTSPQRVERSARTRVWLNAGYSEFHWFVKGRRKLRAIVITTHRIGEIGGRKVNGPPSAADSAQGPG